MNHIPVRSLTETLWRTVDRYPERKALQANSFCLDYGQFGDAVRQVSAWLTDTARIGPGDRIALVCGNSIQFPILYYAILQARAIVVPLNPLLKSDELAYHFDDAGVRLAFTTQQALPHVLSAASRGGVRVEVVRDEEIPGAWCTAPCPDGSTGSVDDTAVLLYTSGTTGRPKAAQLTHRNLVLNADTFARMFGFTESDVVLGALPLFHTFGQTCGMNASISTGAAFLLIDRFEPEQVLRCMEINRVTVFEGVPTMYSSLLNVGGGASRRLDDLRFCASGGASLPLDLLYAFEAEFDCMILEGYGLSETSPVAAFNRPNLPRKPGSVGLPIDGVSMRVVDGAGRIAPAGEVGEIQICGHNVMTGYWNRPDATSNVLDEHGWLSTGDLGYSDEDGFFFIVDRKKDMIIRGGYNVYPREVEEVLYRHPAVREAAVFGIPDRHFGEEIGAAVAFSADSHATPGELRQFVKERIAPYKYPRRIWILDELPKGASGKLLKRQLRIDLLEHSPEGHSIAEFDRPTA